MSLELAWSLWQLPEKSAPEHPTLAPGPDLWTRQTESSRVSSREGGRLLGLADCRVGLSRIEC